MSEAIQWPVYWVHTQTGQEFVTHIEVKHPFDALVKISALYKASKLSDRDYVNNIRLCFTDDTGEDWVDDRDCLRYLSDKLTRE